MRRIDGPSGSGACTGSGIVSRPGLSPKIPTKWQGFRIDPPRSEPSPSGDIPMRSPPPPRPRSRRRCASVVRVPRRAEQPVDRVPPERELGDVGLAEQHRARLPQAADHLAVLVVHAVGEQQRPGRRAHARDRDRILRGERHAVERALLPGRAPRRPRPPPRARVEPRQHERVELRVALGDARRVRVEELERADTRAPGRRSPSTTPSARRALSTLQPGLAGCSSSEP